MQLQLIVVGIDGSEHGTHALEWAGRVAAAQQARLRAVYAWHEPVTSALPGVFGSPVPPADLMQQAAETAAQGFIELAGLPDGVEVEPVVREGGASRVLLDEAQEADLLVVGARGRGGIVGAIVGSVATQVAHHSPIPVAVIP